MVDTNDEVFQYSQPLEKLVTGFEKKNFDQPYENYHSFNMSIMHNNVCFRSSNFMPKTSAAGKNSFLTLAKIGDSITDLKRIEYRGFNIPLVDRYNGMEDPKLIEWRGDTWCLFVRPNYRISKIWMVLLNLNNGESYQLNDPLGRDFTKNWMPVVKNDQLLIVTDVNPFNVYEFIDGKMEKIFSSEKNISPLLIHGSSNIIQVDDKLIGIVHGRFEYARGRWFYWTAFMSWNTDWSGQKLGRPFYFEDRQIEFCLSWDLRGDRIRIPYSVNDSSLSIAEFDKSSLGVLL